MTYLVLLLVLATPAMAQLTRDQIPPAMSSQISDTQLELTNWMMFYYKNPAPDDFPVWLKRASVEGMLSNEKRQFPFLGFEATVFAANPDKISQWMKTIDALPEQEQKTVLIALWLSGTRAAQEALLTESRKKLIYAEIILIF